MTRLTGIRGHLLADACLAAWLDAGDGGPDASDGHGAFRRARHAALSLGPASSVRSMAEVGAAPIARALGYAVVEAGAHEESVELRLRAAGGFLPWLVAPWSAHLDPLWRVAMRAARHLGSRWAWLFNGTHLRLLDASSSHTRRWLEFDLDAAADDASTYAALRLVGRADADAGRLAALVAESDRFAAGVCRSLRSGVLAASEAVLEVVAGRRPPADPGAALDQALTLVYRLLFLLFAESRGLVPMWHPVYRAGYSVESLRLAAEGGRHAGIWDAVRAIGRLAHAGCRTGALSVTAFNGRLFDPRRLPFIERHDLDDRAAGRAVLALTSRPSPARGGRERFAFGDLGVEQLGGVYETLLDYEPRWDDGVRLAAGSGARKASGSFYTPQPMARYVVRRTLEPLVAGRGPEEILALRVLDPSMGSGAFLVAACQYLSEAYEDALVAHGGCRPEDRDETDRARTRRLIAERCLFGVDVNPMAVQLARLSLWLATLARDRPLSFLDHHIRTGNSLVGAWLAALDRPPGHRRRAGTTDTARLFDGDPPEAAARAVLPARFALAGPGDTVEQVRDKERLLASLERDESVLGRWKRAADLWCAWWFADGTLPASAYRALVDAILHGQGPLPAHVADPHLSRAARVADAERFFHWELEFPEVFFAASGARDPHAGFDAVVGNPPWDMLRGDAGAAPHRQSARADAARLVRFARRSGTYAAGATGQANRYQLFVERTVALLRAGGRCGLILPGGLLVDHGSAALRQLLFSSCAVDGLVTFENRRALFPIHRSVRFTLLTATKGSPTRRFGTRFGECDPAVLERDDSGAPEWFPVSITTDLLRRVSGEGLAVPDIRTPRDLAILDRATALFPPAGSRDGWQARFSRELNATDDRHLLHPPGAGLPVVEGKLLAPFVADLGAARHAIRPRDAARRLGSRVQRVRLAYRDVASATNRQTLIAALLPAGCVSTHTVFCLRTPLARWAQHALCGLFNSYVVNYLVRQRVTTHVTTATVEQLPLPAPRDRPDALRRIAAWGRQLARGGGVRTEADADRVAGLNAAVAALYQLSVDEYAHVLGTFPLVPAAERERALRAYRGNPN